MSDRLFVATRKGLFTVDRTGRSDGDWAIIHSAFVGDNVTLAQPDPRDGSVYAALDHGHFGVKFHRSPDGEAWEEAATPTYPERPKDAEADTDAWGKPLEWTTKLIWALAPGDPNRPGTLWCGTAPGGVFHTNDSGKTWSLNRALWDDKRRKNWFGGGLDQPAVHSVCVHPMDPNHLTIGVSCGGVWVTRDAGETWECKADGMWAAYMPPERKHDATIQDPHCVVQCPADPNVLWVQHHNGVFRSTDGAESWHECKDIEPSTFGFAVAVHPSDPDIAWLVPALSDQKRIPVDGKVVVTRTRDGGKSFEALRKGLPDQYAYDITFRHALDVDETGDTLAFGTTTGSLFVSGDQGDSWRCITSHLPPVHSVRFVK